MVQENKRHPVSGSPVVKIKDKSRKLGSHGSHGLVKQIEIVVFLHRIKCSLNLILTAIFHVILPAHYNISSAVMEKAHEETKIIGETKN